MLTNLWFWALWLALFAALCFWGPMAVKAMGRGIVVGVLQWILTLMDAAERDHITRGEILALIARMRGAS